MPLTDKHSTEDVNQNHHWHLDGLWKRWEEKRLNKNAHDEEKFFEFAKVCQEAERYDDMAHAMKKVVKLCTAQRKDLNTEERTLLTSAYKHLIDAHMTSWRKLSAAEKDIIATKEEAQDDKLITDEKAEIIKERKKVEHEIHNICESVIRLMNNFLIPLANGKETVDFYRNIKQEYYSYLFEIGAPEDIEAVLEPLTPKERIDKRFRLVPLEAFN